MNNLVRNDGADAKTERLKWIAAYFHAEHYKQKNASEPQAVPLTKAIPHIEYNLGLSKKRIMEYLEIIESAGQIKIDKDNGLVKPRE